MIYAIVDEKTNKVIGCDIATPEKYISNNHPKNTYMVPVKSINSPVRVGSYWDKDKELFYEKEGV